MRRGWARPSPSLLVQDVVVVLRLLPLVRLRQRRVGQLQAAPQSHLALQTLQGLYLRISLPENLRLRRLRLR
jgi:hypothetical protein